jgi:hypothetical protein
MVEDLAKHWREVLSRRYGSFGIELVDELVANIVDVYERFIASGCADTQFQAQLRSHDKKVYAQRLGEMLLFDRLSHAGFKLQSKDMGPDFRAEKNGEMVWIELVTPSSGDDTKINELFDSHNPLSPSADDSVDLRNRTLLRICAGINAKLEKFEKYIKDGLVQQEDPCVIVVNDALMCPDVSFYGLSFGAESGNGGLSLVEHATLGVGHASWVKDGDSDNYKLEHTFREVIPNRPEPTRDGRVRDTVPGSFFAQPTTEKAKEQSDKASIISAIMQITLREDYGFVMKIRTMAEKEDRRTVQNIIYPGTLVHNLNASVPLPKLIGTSLMQIYDLPPLSVEEFIVLSRQYFSTLFGKDVL